ncbi:hypothetical protein HPB49_003491 [Dermacentor silvarum]|uniref:Uncharacterized protein n=1 Tax=Dermacentor silvarum TaxID=543639 RepID=A0ACB8DU02_DERSI|nr:hypothetical protein HPB49_003491 [Dermacentor silvarum]
MKATLVVLECSGLNLCGRDVLTALDLLGEPCSAQRRKVPYALRLKVEAEVDRLVENEILAPVPHLEWAAPVMAVVKRKGNILLSGDSKNTLNQACHTIQYPLLRIEDITATLNGSELFTTIDLRDAYNQIALDEESQLLTTSFFASPAFRSE